MLLAVGTSSYDETFPNIAMIFQLRESAGDATATPASVVVLSLIAEVCGCNYIRFSVSLMNLKLETFCFFTEVN